ncbi:hypothetical protein ASPVEDRAFT_153196 [Aspergillus versicolor CBS 583.65]|uniref:Ubiquitin 3 binding protein But2 C-terminal domain-containing protein n=1 Tax=Aspergillus versicolor CBS 583.65 TaxID=1036611 RepID=A0A1L9PTX3_ASPVE|nr:uncharacterized protein ASPVEDRAFT_153196 [Aspergillus versicolor CBS 583.65]OJJ04875.1 hypothetical protein ASPVEDRAFT_153196 [Aspergillus versicolor CBS 583.65]
MKFSSVAPLLAAVPGTLGAALPLATRGQDAAQITFIGAADAQFTQDFPKDGSAVTITNPLSISHISSNNPDVTCTFTGIDDSSTTTNGVAFVDVGPPQTQVQGSCKRIWHPETRSPNGGAAREVEITFTGAADAQYKQSFPIDGGVSTIGESLSVSHISSSTGGVKCTFYGVDGSNTVVEGAQTVDVGPPQTQSAGHCAHL